MTEHASEVPCLVACLPSHPMRKARNRLLFTDPLARLAETRNLPKIGGVIIRGQRWIPEQVSMRGATGFSLWGFGAKESQEALDRMQSAES